MADIAPPSDRRTGARAYARLGGEQNWRAPAPANTAQAPSTPNTVTLDKIGDFLELDFGRLFVWLRNGLILTAILAIIGTVLGGAFAVLSKPRYTVTTDIMIDPANLQVVEGDVFSQPGQVDGQLLIAGSKLRVLTSRNVLTRVVADLDLVNDTEFYDTTPPLFSLPNFSGGGTASASTEDPSVIAVRALSERVATKSDEKSFVASLMVSSESTDKAIAISAGIVQAFRDELAEAEADGASRAATSLDNRLDELKTDVQAAEERVQTFRRENKLAMSGDGQLVSTQTMNALNAQVVAAQARVIEARTTYDALAAAGAQANPSTGTAATSLPALRDRAGALQQQLLSQSMLLGPRHPTIVGLTAELDAVQTQIRTEIDRAVASAKTALDDAETNLAALTAESANLTSAVFTDNDLQVQLRELERDATSKTVIYESFLSRARQITEREQIDTTNVRVISTAVPPKGRSWPPRTVLVMGIGGFLGLFLGMVIAVCVGIWRDMRNPPAAQTAPQ
ncbi:GumC family protein [Devosia sp. BSSL-BM10]|jgi:polysaccharide biosynthesis transport protein|uniref:GumC family protein n=1 Tax=Devosia litorisediminis TaxID=2829817 RepID=A0A942ICX5_9HYPH|nr:GumC family protein [Devosia litorisediminis]MBS3847630.1 GumC family protein [Devosia litorisediminis]